MKRLYVLQLALLLSITCAASGQGLKLIGEQKIMELTKDVDNRENQGMFSMRLSPDGSKLLFLCRFKDGEKRGYKYVLRDIGKGVNVDLPVLPVSMDDFAVAHISMKPFDASGKLIVLPVGVDEDGDGVLDFGKEKMQFGIYDIATAKLRTMAVKDLAVLASFDSAGKGLVVMTLTSKEDYTGRLLTTPADKLAEKRMGVWGLTRSVCPTADVIPVCLPPNRNGDPSSRQRGVLVYDLKEDKTIATLPVHPRNTHLDDYNPQWTANGRYLFYVDYNEGEDGEDSRGKMVSRIWDRRKKEIVSTVGDCVPVGPGPGDSAMVLVKRERNNAGRSSKLILHDVAKGERIIADGSVRPISISGKHLLYVKMDQNGTGFVCMAQLPEFK